MKATTVEIQFIQRLFNIPPDPVVQSELFGYSYTRVIDALEKKFRKADQDDMYEIAFQTIDQFIKAPQKFDPEKNTLISYLVMDAIGDMRNLLSKKSREKKITFFVEDWKVDGNNLVEETSNQELEEVALVNLEAMLRHLFPDNTDFEFARMMEMGIRETHQYAKVLEIESQSVEEQRTIVKRHKDRIGKQMDRSNWKAFKKKIRDQFL